MAQILGLGRVEKTDRTSEEIYRDLTIENPQYTKLVSMGKYVSPDIPKNLYFFYEDKEHFYVPRYYYSDAELNLVKGDKIDIDFDIELRDYQHRFFKDNEILDSDITDFVLNMKTGNGKTVCGLHAINQIKRRALVVCETKYLVNQWVSRIKKFRNVKDSGTKEYIYNNIIINNKTKLETILNNDISIITLKGYNSLSAEIKEALAKHIGVLVMDEGHRLGAKTFYSILEELPARYRILLTATFRRKDEMIRMLEYTFGTVYSLPNQLPKAHLYYVRTGVTMTNLLPKSKFKNPVEVQSELEKCVSLYSTRDYFAYRRKLTAFDYKLSSFDSAVLQKFQNNQQNVDLMKFFTQEQSRRRKLIKMIRVAKQRGRKVLVASPFIDVMYDLKKALPELNVFILDGDTNAKLTPDQLEEKLVGVDVIFGSMKVVQEGMDVDWLDTLIIYWPISDIEQLVGRITRITPTKKYPKVFYFMDNNSFSQSMIKKSQVYNDNFQIKGTFDFLSIIKTL